MTLTNCYCTVAELKIELQKTTDSATVTTNILEQAITRASRYIDQTTGRIYYSKTLASELCDIYGMSDNGIIVDGYRLDFSAPLISSITVAEDGTTLTVNEDYYVYNNQMKIEKDWSIWSTLRKAISFSGTFGYVSTPGHINHICLVIAAAISGLSSKIITDEDGNSMAIIRNSIPDWCKDVLKKERRRMVV